jgi:hypothetical protein
LLEAILHEDPEWLSVQIEATRRVRTEERFREQVERLDQEAKKTRPSRMERLQPSVREDIPIEVTVQFLTFVANGLAIARTTGDELPDLDLLNTLVESGVGRR